MREILKHLLIGSYPKKPINYETPIQYPNSQISKTLFTKLFPAKTPVKAFSS